MRHWRLVLALAIFFVPFLAIFLIDGPWCARATCGWGLTFALYLYGAALAAFFALLLIARLCFRALRVPGEKRMKVVKTLLILPMLPGLIIIGLFFWGLVS